MKSSPIRRAFVGALARRTEAHQGAVRERLEARLAELSESEGPQESVKAVLASVPVKRGPLGLLADSLATRHAHTESEEGAQTPLAAASVARRELGTLREFRGTWSRLFAEQRLRQTLAQVPTQAGPLNSHHLVHRALATMQEVSPEYLQRFVTHVDTLLWLEQRQAPVVGQAARPEKRRKVKAR